MSIKFLKPQRDSRYNQGYINPASCKKLFESQANTPIIFRSSYEKKFIFWLEKSPIVKRWASECIYIPYLLITDQKMHKYYPDYFVELENGEKWVVEVKPYNQTIPPKDPIKNQWARNEYIKNMCKWKATKEFCDKNNMQFKIITERTIERL